VKIPRAILCLPLLLGSCAKDHKPAAPPAAPKPLSQRINETNGYQVDANGNWVPRSDRRSSFESQGESPYFKGDYRKKNYQAGEYSKKSWWGNKDYGRQSYQGKTDGSRFRQSSRLDGTSARESGSSARTPGPYQTGSYATDDAREAGVTGIAKPSDAETDVRRRVFQQPDIIDWREQRALSVQESRGILGR
jgi:hypothetical protein